MDPNFLIVLNKLWQFYGSSFPGFFQPHWTVTSDFQMFSEKQSCVYKTHTRHTQTTWNSDQKFCAWMNPYWCLGLPPGMWETEVQVLFWITLNRQKLESRFPIFWAETIRTQLKGRGSTWWNSCWNRYISTKCFASTETYFTKTSVKLKCSNQNYILLYITQH